MLINMGLILEPAKAQRYGVVGACPHTRDQIGWCFETAAQLRAPIIICKAASARFPIDLTLEDFADTVKHYSKRYPKVPVALCLDHGDTLETAVRAMKAGFTGVMVDKSHDPLSENIETMRKVVKIAHSAGVAVEAAVGGSPKRDPSPEEIRATLTKVDELVELVGESGVDVVAVFVGNRHGDYKEGTSAYLEFRLIKRLANATPAALSMHGSSATGDANLRKAARLGISKFNVSGDLMAGGTTRLEYVLRNHQSIEKGRVREYYEAMKNGYKRRLAEYMTFLGSVNRF